MIKPYLVIKNFTSWITKLSQRFFGYFDLFNTLKEVHIYTTHNQYDTSMHIFISYNLQVAGIAEMAFTWTQ